ncbi:hypothetical protein [Flectobacillus sp. BAB-3569]|uniref:hypothetical protein n=1 Tax=Flectobacillus sp. BAB-3569 TaxID=1509483 RepID=UPI000BA3DBA0|nr:hypothetical protein [Flectobacillus sp. BAB-3569]PAC28756.1 hypothetical protein BWI92_19495 [Flectobacillus sp. BAB-3569]
MAVNHKFKDFDFKDGFTTTNVILKTSYNPQVLILGTFNPLTNEEDNMADFFYGRNWFWTCMFNLFHHQAIHLLTQRKFTQIPNYNPTLDEIKVFCEKYKLTFADLISTVLFNNNIEYNLHRNKALIVNEEYDLINDGDLGKLNAINQVEWTTEDLKKYITETPSLHTVYFTRQPAEPYTTQWTILKNHDYGRIVEFKKIFTPSGQGLRGRPRVNHLIHHWLFNENDNYDQLNNDWLLEHNIDRNIFAIP